MKETNTIIYTSPLIDICEVQSEKGFASSSYGSGIDNLQWDSYGEE